mmetsp:Transcript_38924/g.94125  ORF Transcript_38924/g.94125 Transcript_38924/m.94125 type:complete len:450 (-) Transcript_38924:207-1556(-)
MTENTGIDNNEKQQQENLLRRNAKFVVILGGLLLLSFAVNEKGVTKSIGYTSSSTTTTRQKKKKNYTITNDHPTPRPIILPKEPREYYEQFPACQIRVYNMLEVHYEVIESVAKQIPYEYLNLTTTTTNYTNINTTTQQQQHQCNHYHLHFEFDSKASGKLRAKTWLADMNDRVNGTLLQDFATNITRSFGPAYLGVSPQLHSDWDATIQVSCACDAATRDWLLLDTAAATTKNICINHGKCNWTDAMPNSIQVSPHFERYFVPSALPKFDLLQDFGEARDDKLEICTIGSTWRRNWRLVVPFLQDASNANLWDKIRFRFLGKGGMPYPLRPYHNLTLFQPNQIGDDRKYYAAERACGMIMLPISRIPKGKNYMHYFKSVNGSAWKLSGTIPPIIAFERPFLVPNEILDLYRRELPLHVPHRGFDDLEPNGFAEALSSLLEELLSLMNK